MTQHRMSLTTAADTLAAIPALLGFTPDNSVVIIALADDGNGSHLVAPTARVDAHQAEAAAGIITDALPRQDTPVTAVILAAIADTTHAGAALLGLDAIRDALAAAGIRTIRALHTYSLTAGTTFTDLDRFTDGTIPDPATTELAKATGEALGIKVKATGNRRLQPVVNKFFYWLRASVLETNRVAYWWANRMVASNSPLQEKMALFWHGIFATGYPKVIHGKALSDQTRMFRHYGMGSFRTLLLELSKDPAMIIWLDNQDNHKGAINENFGR